MCPHYCTATHHTAQHSPKDKQKSAQITPSRNGTRPRPGGEPSPFHQHRCCATRPGIKSNRPRPVKSPAAFSILSLFSLLSRPPYLPVVATSPPRSSLLLKRISLPVYRGGNEATPSSPPNCTRSALPPKKKIKTRRLAVCLFSNNRGLVSSLRLLGPVLSPLIPFHPVPSRHGNIPSSLIRSHPVPSYPIPKHPVPYSNAPHRSVQRLYSTRPSGLREQTHTRAALAAAPARPKAATTVAKGRQPW